MVDFKNRVQRLLFFYTTEITGATKVSQYIQKCLGDSYITTSYICKSDDETEIEQILIEQHPDIVFCSFIHLSPIVIKTAHRIGNIRIIIRNDYFLKDVDKIRYQEVLKTYQLADLLIAQTEQMRLELLSLNVHPSKIVVLSNPLDKEKIRMMANDGGDPYPDDDCFHYLWVGRKDPIKDLETLKTSFSIVRKHFPNSTLTLISDNPNPYRWMKHADCFILSSKSEASPNVLKEALFLQVPVVSTSCSPIVEKLVNNGKNGYIVEVGNAMMMANAMIDVRNLSFQSHSLFLPTDEEIKTIFKN